MVDAEKIILMDRDRIERSLKRIAQQIAELNREDKRVILAGINTRGYAVASAIKTYLSPVYDDVACMPLEIEEDTLNGWDADEVTGRNFIVLVDDVIFSGRTMFQALVRLSEVLEDNEIHTAVLVDRGHRKLPVEAEFVGMELPTKLKEHVSVVVGDEQQVRKVVLEKS